MIVIGLLGAWSYYVFVGKSSVSSSTDIDKKWAAHEERIRAFAAKYNATTGWEKDLQFTLDAQERLVNGKPALFQAFIDDVYRLDGTTYMRFSSSFVEAERYVLELQCDPQLVAGEVLRYGEYLVVANIDDVSSPTIALTGSGELNGPIELEAPFRSFFTARGKCVAVQADIQ